MRRLFGTTSLMVLSFFVWGQGNTNSAEEALFDEAFALLEDENFDAALSGFQQFWREYPDSELIPRVHYNIGYILKLQGRFDEAKNVFKEILAGNYNEKEKGGHGILGPPFALYKHFSCEHLTDIYLAEQNFKEAKRYIRLLDQKYPYEHFCSRERKSFELYKALSYAKVLEGQGKRDAALRQLIPHTFSTGLADNRALLEELLILLEKKYGKEGLESALKQAIRTLNITYSKKKGDIATINLLGYKVTVYEGGMYNFSNPDLLEDMLLEGRDKFLKIIRKNELFKYCGVE